MCHISQWSSEIVYCISRVENEIEFSTRDIHDIFPTTTKKTANIRHPFKLQILFDRAADKTYIFHSGRRKIILLHRNLLNNHPYPYNILIHPL
jgi:hypothetical protein